MQDSAREAGRNRKRSWRWTRFAAAMAVVGAGLGALLYSRTLSSASALEASLADARHFADSLERADNQAVAESIGTADVVAILYLQRLHFGLGSPFRLIEQAMRDEDLGPAYRRRIPLAMLARTLAGTGYQTDAEALRLIDTAGDHANPAVGTAHLRLIRSLISGDRDPRVGELAVRLAYRLASASGAVSRRAPEIATNVASQLRDRVLAGHDAQALFEAAARSRGDVLSLLRRWRENRRFAVERPVIAPLSARVERLATARLPAALDTLEHMAAHPPANSNPEVAVAGEGGTKASTVTRLGLARRMAGVARARNLPPQAPVTVIVSGYAPLIRRATWSAADYADRQRFIRHARNEEELTAEYALLRQGGRRALPAAALTMLTAGVALRPYAQERPEPRADEAVTLHEVEARFGISVSFGKTINPAWRTYLLGTLSQALTDLRRVLPSYDPRGLRIRFGATPLGARALALHDPVTRTIYFPATSSAGVMAHEFAHDLDWQAARRAYGRPSGYRTDRAVRQGASQLAGALRQMASAVRLDTIVGRPDAPSRPTEVFARNVDWFVSAALARDGRMNGFLSAVQDPLLIGYASATTPEAAREGGSATLRALEGMTTVPQPIRSWFSAHFGADRRISVHEVVRQVLEVRIPRSDVVHATPNPLAPRESFDALLRRGPAASAAWGCLLDEFVQQAVDPAAARAVALDAAEARARGIVRGWVAFARRHPDVATPRLRALSGPPWRPAIVDEQTSALRDDILWRAFGGGRHAGSPAMTLKAADGLRALTGCAAGR